LNNESAFDTLMAERRKAYYDSNPAIPYLNNKYKTGCDHIWQYKGHGHNDDHYKCMKCDLEGDY